MTLLYCNLVGNQTHGFQLGGRRGAIDNDGATWTQALLWNSPAIDAGEDILCPATDQRGLGRPKDGNGDNVPVCDIGAYELQQAYQVVYLPILWK